MDDDRQRMAGHRIYHTDYVRSWAKQDKVKVIILNKLLKFHEMDTASIVENTEWTRFCPQTDRRTDGRTDGRTDRQTDGQGETSLKQEV